MKDENKIQETVNEFVDLVRNIDGLRRRNSFINRMFWEYNNININELEDTEMKYKRIVSEKKSYPSAFLASSLGFNKGNLNSRYLQILNAFGLDKKPRAPSLRNALAFEKLKLLIIKYFDKYKQVKLA